MLFGMNPRENQRFRFLRSSQGQSSQIKTSCGRPRGQPPLHQHLATTCGPDLEVFGSTWLSSRELASSKRPYTAYLDADDDLDAHPLTARPASPAPVIQRTTLDPGRRQQLYHSAEAFPRASNRRSPALHMQRAGR